jgi:acetyl esterase/lipase
LTGGVSGGGNLTTQAIVLARDEHLQPALTGHLLVCTGMPHDHTGKEGGSFNLFPERLRQPHGSWEKYKDGPVATRQMNAIYGGECQCSRFDPPASDVACLDISRVRADDYLATPLTQTDYSCFGPVYYQAAEMDIWRDSAIFHCEKIREAGGQAKIDIYPGVVHTWWSMYPQLTINKKWIKDLVDGTEWLLKQNQDRGTSSKL